jgi:hypothetical protein
MGIRDPLDFADVHQIAVPEVGAGFENSAPDMQPFVVTEDDRARVPAVLVPHCLMFPSFAFRFDTDHGSVTFSGETTYGDDVIRLANGSDVPVQRRSASACSALPRCFLDHHLQLPPLTLTGRWYQGAEVRGAAVEAGPVPTPVGDGRRAA